MLNKYPINRVILIYTPRPLYFHLNKTIQIAKNLFYYKMTKLKTKSNIINFKKKLSTMVPLSIAINQLDDDDELEMIS